MSRVIVLVVALSVPASASAETQPFAWNAKYRHTADIISWVLVSVNVGMSAVKAYRSPNRKHALICVASRYGITSASTRITKAVVDRTRPDGSDDRSFWSGHTAFASVSAGWYPKAGIPIAAGTGYGRMAANRHYTTDVAAGAAVGWSITKVCEP